MTDEEIVEIAIKELSVKSLGVTEQYLEVLEVNYENGKPKVERVDNKSENGFAVVYFSVKDQRFYLVADVNTTKLCVQGMNTEAYLRVYFRATSEELDLSQLPQMTTLIPTESWNKGDLRESGKSTHTFSAIKFLPNPEPDVFEDKLKKLLDYLEQDEKGVKALVENAYGHIIAAVNSYISDAFNPTLDKEIIKRLSNLNLEIDFDTYIGGEKLKSIF